MIIGHGSVPFVVVIGAKHPYLNTGQTLTANTSENVKLCHPYRDSGFVLWPTAVCHFRDFDCV
jgi:hypothetical protein